MRATVSVPTQVLATEALPTNNPRHPYGQDVIVVLGRDQSVDLVLRWPEVRQLAAFLAALVAEHDAELDVHHQAAIVDAGLIDRCGCLERDHAAAAAPTLDGGRDQAAGLQDEAS